MSNALPRWVWLSVMWAVAILGTISLVTGFYVYAYRGEWFWLDLTTTLVCAVAITFMAVMAWLGRW